MTIGQATERTARILREAGIDQPWLEARLLAGKATGCSATALVTERERPIGEGAEAELQRMTKERASHRPMAYILGHRAFYDLDFRVDERVLVPQPDTETLVDTVLSRLRPDPSLAILDLCTGSGCVGITLARHLGCRVTLADISPEALEVAAANARDLLPPGRYALACGDLYEAAGGIFDVIVSNPPYLTRSWIAEADEEVRKEPLLALYGGEDGTLIPRRVIAGAAAHLHPGGMLALECDPRQAPALADFLLANGFATSYIEKDLAGRDRVVWGATKDVRTADRAVHPQDDHVRAGRPEEDPGRGPVRQQET